MLPTAESNKSLNIEKSKTSLVVIDLQKGIASFPVSPHDTKTVVSNATKLADSFRVRFARTESE